MDYPGNYEYYKEKKNEFKKNKIETPIIEKERKSQRKDNTEKQASNNKLKEAESLENTIHELEVKLKDIDIEMNNNGREYEKLLELGKEKEKIQEQLDLVIEKWLDVDNS